MSKILRTDNVDFVQHFVNKSNQINNAYKAASFQTKKIDDYILQKQKKLHVHNQQLEPKSDDLDDESELNDNNAADDRSSDVSLNQLASPVTSVIINVSSPRDQVETAISAINSR